MDFSENFGSLTDYLAEYQDGRMTAEAKAIYADRNMIAKVFHVLKWTRAELERTITTLLQDGTIQEIEIKGLEHPQLLSSHILKQVS